MYPEACINEARKLRSKSVLQLLVLDFDFEYFGSRWKNHRRTRSQRVCSRLGLFPVLSLQRNSENVNIINSLRPLSASYEDFACKTSCSFHQMLLVLNEFKIYSGIRRISSCRPIPGSWMKLVSTTTQ